MLYLEKEFGGTIRVTMRVAGSQKEPLLLLLAALEGPQGANGGRRLLASASVSMPARGVGATDAALLSLMYELDKDVYRRTQGMGLKG